MKYPKSDKCSDKISVIIPAYNVEKRIRKCVESIIFQDYKNLEIIIINDGSTDETQAVCKTLEKADKRVVVYQQSNKGVSAARNRGIELATGKYICFVDSDDYIDSHFFTNLVSNMSAYQADMVVCGYREISEAGEAKEIQHSQQILSGKEIMAKMLMMDRVPSPFLWNKLFEKQIIRNIRFAEDYTYSEDLLFLFEVFKQVRRSVVIPYIGYNYIKREDSITHASFSEEHLKILDVHKKIEDEIKRHYPSLIEEAQYFTSVQLYVLIKILLSEGLSASELNKYAYNMIKREMREYPTSLVWRQGGAAMALKWFGIRAFPQLCSLILKGRARKSGKQAMRVEAKKEEKRIN